MSTEPGLPTEDPKVKLAPLIALLGSFIANHKPFVAKIEPFLVKLGQLAEAKTKQPTEEQIKQLIARLKQLAAIKSDQLTESVLEPVIEDLIEITKGEPLIAETPPSSSGQAAPTEPGKLRDGWQRLTEEFKDQTKPARKKRVGVASSGMGLTLWIIVGLYLIFGMPGWLNMLPSGGSRDFFWAAVAVALLVGATAFFLTKRTLLRVREMLWTLGLVELVLLGSIWFMTGLNPFDQINLFFILTWFLYMQIFILVPWIGSWALTHWFGPFIKKKVR